MIDARRHPVSTLGRRFAAGGFVLLTVLAGFLPVALAGAESVGAVATSYQVVAERTPSRRRRPGPRWSRPRLRATLATAGAELRRRLARAAGHRRPPPTLTTVLRL